jgi:hypothetical protein
VHPCKLDHAGSVLTGAYQGGQVQQQRADRLRLEYEFGPHSQLNADPARSD